MILCGLGGRQPRKTLRLGTYPHHADSFGFPSTKWECTDAGHREKVEIYRSNCLTIAATQRTRQGSPGLISLPGGLLGEEKGKAQISVKLIIASLNAKGWKYVPEHDDAARVS